MWFRTFVVEEILPVVADEVTLFILQFLVEEEMRKAECSGALPEPPFVHRFDALRGCEEADCQWHQEVVNK